MAKWKVDLSQTVYERCSVEVEAETEQDAERLALKMAPDQEWQFDDVGDREILDVVKQS